MRTGPNHNRLLAALAALLAAMTLRAASLENLERMCHAGKDEYRSLRTAIVAEGESALPFLDATLADETKPWKVRFMAGVCTDHIRHGKEIEAFLKHDWRQDPDLQEFWGPGPYIPITGFPRGGYPVFYQRMKELGTWWFFIESMFSLDRSSLDWYHPYRNMGRGVILHAPMPSRYFAAKWAEERFSDRFSGKAPYAGDFIGYLREFALDGTYPEGADLLLAHPERCIPPDLESLVQVTTNLALLEELKTRMPNIIHYRGFKSRVEELRKQQEEAEAAARAARAESEARAEAAARAALAKRVLFAVAASAVLLAAALLLHRALHRRQGGKR